ncbi:MAG: hypothetical protein AAF328_03170 [Planctomycetota bacterium]
MLLLIAIFLLCVAGLRVVGSHSHADAALRLVDGCMISRKHLASRRWVPLPLLHPAAGRVVVAPRPTAGFPPRRPLR